MYIVHVYTCIYYLVSRLQGLGGTEWVYNGQGLAYVSGGSKIQEKGVIRLSKDCFSLEIISLKEGSNEVISDRLLLHNIFTPNIF